MVPKSKKSSMMQMRVDTPDLREIAGIPKDAFKGKHPRSVMIVGDMYVGNMLIDGTFYFDATSFHLVKGKAEVQTSADIVPAVRAAKATGQYPEIYVGGK